MRILLLVPTLYLMAAVPVPVQTRGEGEGSERNCDMAVEQADSMMRSRRHPAQFFQPGSSKLHTVWDASLLRRP